MKRLLLLPLSVMLLASGSCDLSSKPNYIYVPPKTDRGLSCVKTCASNRDRCIRDCTADRDNTLGMQNDGGPFLSNRNPRGIRDFLFRSEGTQEDCDQVCLGYYNTCHHTCGGRVIEHKS